jgi:hypothetical protein
MRVRTPTNSSNTPAAGARSGSAATCSTVPNLRNTSNTFATWHADEVRDNDPPNDHFLAFRHEPQDIGGSWWKMDA